MEASAIPTAQSDDSGSLRIIEVEAHGVPEHGFQLLHPIRLGEDGMTQGYGLIAAFRRLLDGVSETTYRRAVMKFGENGVIDMIGVAGYFTTVSMVMNVAHSPPPEDKPVTALFPYPF